MKQTEPAVDAVDRVFLLKNLIASRGGILEMPCNGLTVTGTVEGPGRKPEEVSVSIRSLETVLREDITVELYGGYSAGWEELSEEEQESILSYALDRFGVNGNPEWADRQHYDLRRLNLGFIREYGDLEEKDFKKMDLVKDAIEKARLFSGNDIRPLPGDSVEGAYYGGKFPFKNGMLDTPYDWYEEGEVSLCAGPYSPFTRLADWRQEGYSFSMSGGPYFKMSSGDLEYVGTDERLFTVWGHWGACANGDIRFPVKVNRWKVKEGVDY